MSDISPDAWRAVQDAERAVATAELERAQRLPKAGFGAGLGLFLYDPELPLPTADIHSSTYLMQSVPAFELRQADVDVPSTFIGLGLMAVSVARSAQNMVRRRREAHRILRSSPNDLEQE